MILGNPNTPMMGGPGPGNQGGVAPQMPQRPMFAAGQTPGPGAMGAMQGAPPQGVPSLGNPMAGGMGQAAPITQMGQGGMGMPPSPQQGGLNRQLIQSRMLRGMR